MRTLVVYSKNREAGVLGKFRDGSYEFRYTTGYRRDSATASVAFALPKSRAVHRSKTLFPFFYGLLAEGAQKRACRRCGARRAACTAVREVRFASSYSAPDFIQLGKAYGLDEGAVLKLIRLFRSKADAVEDLTHRSFLSSDAQLEYLRIYHDRLNAFRDVS